MSSSRAIAILNRFKSSLVQFLDDIIETFPREETFVTMRILVKDQVSTVLIMEAFLEDLVRIEAQIAARDSEFFTHTNPIFAKIGYPAGFAAIWNSPGMTNANRDTMWLWLGEIVKLARMYSTA